MTTTFHGRAERFVQHALELYAASMIATLATENDEDNIADLTNDIGYANSLIRAIVANQGDKCALIRTDDHGNEVVVHDNLDRDDARVLYRIMSARGHKQSYEIRRMRQTERTAEQA
jgi:hypothetical protein